MSDLQLLYRELREQGCGHRAAVRQLVVLELLPAYQERAKQRQAEGLRRGDEPAPAEPRSSSSIRTGSRNAHGSRAVEEVDALAGISGATVLNGPAYPDGRRRRRRRAA